MSKKPLKVLILPPAGALLISYRFVMSKLP